MGRKCKDCKWYQEKKRWAHKIHTLHTHECRRHPPFWVTLPIYSDYFKVECMYPEIRSDLDACGEWEERTDYA
jgi:hypothetical protein